MSFISHLREFFGPAPVSEGDAQPGEQLTVAALLTLVMHADGRILEVEEKGLRKMLQSRFGLTEAQAGHLIARARGDEARLDPATALVDRIVHDIPPADRPRILALAYRIAAIDGTVHEFEDNLIWRTGRLLGLSDADLGTIKEDALAHSDHE